MVESGTERESLLRIADELRDLTGRIAGVCDALSAHATAERRLPQAVAVAAPTVVENWDADPDAQDRFVLAADQVPVSSTRPEPGQWSLFPPGDDAPNTRNWADGARAATWDRLGGRFLAWVGGAVTVLGVVLLLVLAIQRGWLGPVPRLFCGAGFAAALVAAGARVHRMPAGRIGAFALAATGFVVLYLDVIAATALYHYLPTVVGLLAGLVVGVLGLLLADRWDSQTMAMFVVLATAAGAPLITHGVTPLLVGFLLALVCAATPIQLRRNWPNLALAAEAPLLIAALALDNVTAGGKDVTVTAVLALVTVVFCMALALVTVWRGGDERVALALLLGAPLPAMPAAPLLAMPYATGLLGIVTLLLFGIWTVDRVYRLLPANFAAGAGAAGTVVLFQATVITVHGSALPITLLCQSILLAVVAERTTSRGTLLVAAAYAAAGTVGALLGPVPLALLRAGRHATTGTVVAAALIMLTALLLGWAAMRMRALSSPAAWTSVGIVGLYGFSSAVLGAALLIAPGTTSFLVGHLVITVGWTVAALLLLAKGIDSLPARITGLALVSAAVLKLFTFDLVTLDGIIRVGAFLGAGIVLLAAGVCYARILAGRRTAGEDPAELSRPNAADAG
ncbi:MAG TPA: DUF2339 domain-containing protein [Pseudonocardiaceae bacterium]|nr:DUF2339 domain-containing protein [Pseudonocardiaceae bacterium]